MNAVLNVLYWVGILGGTTLLFGLTAVLIVFLAGGTDFLKDLFLGKKY